tara:strand:+ start:144 stop:449 length:306 start_codon:yes stop_codon:yes gene_type:complete
MPDQVAILALLSIFFSSLRFLIIQQIRLNKVLKWAQHMNYEIPDRKKPNWKSYLLLTILFISGIIPGMLYALLMLHRKAQFDRKMKPLERMWIEAGRPEKF